jgi:ABC-2 type transport system ATP-binding protein
LLELVFADGEVARQAAADLMAQGLDVTADGQVVHCRMKVKGGVGAVLAGLGPLTSAVQHIREIPMPIRDLIAQVYAREGAAQGGKR